MTPAPTIARLIPSKLAFVDRPSLAQGDAMKTAVLVLVFAVAASSAGAADSLTVAPPPTAIGVAGAPAGATDSSAVASAADTVKAPRAEIRAARLQAPINLDGLLSEPIWGAQPSQAAFVQSDPNQGERPTFATDVRVVYDDDAIYVGARMHDSNPDSIVSRLCRRDENSRSDEFTVYFDPYLDRRSGYWFVISAAGTLRDGILFNDGWDDNSWDGIWQGRARIDSSGWTAEMRIPYSQLRFKKSDQYRWGVNFRRYIARRNEYDMVAYTPRKESGFVSRFPDLVGISSVTPPRAIQVTPYMTTKGEFLQHASDDPFNDGSRYVPETGGDLKMAVGSKLTLNASINPDFGQVEVDPAVVNLSDVETFFPEKRPFFVEGSSNYDFGEGGSNSFWGFNWPGATMFYSRRIGRAPVGGNYTVKVGDSFYDADHADVPHGTSILGAAKLTGKIMGDWNLGVMQALTAREMAKTALGAARGEAEVEPFTSYSVLRTQKEFHEGRQGIGTITTLAARSFDDQALAASLNKNSLVAGLDGWTFLDKSKTWVLTGWTAMSRLEGTADRIAAVQRGSTHYLQRPDAVNWRYDPTATSLTGFAGRFTLNRQSGNLIQNAALGFINPLFDTNDLGFMSRADVVNAHVVTGYRWTEPKGWRRYADFKIVPFGSMDFDGNVSSPGIWTGGGIEFANYWSIWPRFSYGFRSVNTRLTRGGPSTISPRNYNGGFYFETDGRKKIFYSFDVGGSRSWSGGWGYWAYPAVQWKPAANLQVNVGPGFERTHQNSQWVGSVPDPGATQTFDRRYVFAALDQTTISASLRLNWAFTPNMSLQTYIQPLVSSGNYFDYKQLVRSRSYEWEPVGSGVPQYDPVTDQIDLDGAGPGDPQPKDFNLTSLRGNAVLRWEYMPGSTMFLVWTQDRSSYEEGRFELGPAFSPLLDARPNNIFLAKVTYYLNL
jgi:hypothetical protein